VQKLDVTIARLRLLLADVSMRQAQGTALSRQLHDQLQRIVTFTLYGDNDLDRSLTLMADVEERLQSADREGRHLTLIRERVERELESLLLTKGVEEAKARLVQLQHRHVVLVQTLAGEPATPVDLSRAERELAGEIRALQQEIAAASERAARTIDSQARR
jgi:hypothetical protein